MRPHWIKLVRLELWMAILLLGSVSAAYASGKNHQAAVSGLVCDESGCVVTNVKIWVTNARTGFRRESVTDKKGRFVVLNLDPGTYSLRAQSPGFAVVEISGLVLRAKNNRGLRLRLRPNATPPTSVQQPSGPPRCPAIPETQ